MATDKIIESAVGDIHVSDKVAKDLPIDTSFEFTPQNPFTIDIPSKEGELPGSVAYPGYPVDQSSGFFETAKAEFEEMSTNAHILHQAGRPLREPANLQVQQYYPEVNDKFYHPAPAGWSPKQEIEKLTNVDPKFITKLLSAKNPDDFNFLMSSIKEQEHRDEVLQNGSTMAKILGGLVGISPIGSIEDFYPLTAIATKAKVGTSFISNLTKNVPGLLGASAIREGAHEMDKIDGNVADFLKDTFIDAAFGTIFFGAIGAGKSLVNNFELNSLKQFARDHLDGVGFNFRVDKAGNLKGFEAVDTTGGSLSAAKVTRAQEQADAAFYKGGLFKIPYVGTASLALISGNIPGFKYLLGSPLIQLKTSEYKAANAFADAAFDHFITTEGEAKGGVRPKSFELKVKQTRAMLTALKVETDALHAERNGYSITARPTLAIQNAWSAIKQKSIETLSRESQTTDYISREGFMDEVQRVLFSKESSEHAAVNTLAAKYRNVFDTTIQDYLKAYNLPEDYFRNMDKYLSRVYDTPYMNANEVGNNGFVPIIANWYKEADELITTRMQPIKDLESQLKAHKESHAKLIKQPKVSDSQIKASSDRLDKLRNDLKYSNEKLQNELRANPELDYHIEDRYALSANEARELTKTLKPLNKLKKQMDEQQSIVSSLKNQKSKAQQSSLKGKTVETAKKHADAEAIHQEQIKVEEEKLNELKKNVQDEEYNLYDRARNGEINPRLFNPLNHKFKDPNDRLKFRDVYESHPERLKAAKASYDSIMQMHPEDIISDMFGKMMGNAESNPLKKRTLMVPDEILYNNNFMTKDLYAKTANYVNFLSRKTHLKTSFDNVTVNGNFEELGVNLQEEYQAKRELINQRIEKLTDKKEISKEKKKLDKEAKKFGDIKNVMKNLFENRMMGINKRNDFDTMARRTWMSLTAAVNLHNLPGMQITDFAFGGFQHGIWPFIRDGVAPIMQSLGGILKTKNAEALREMAPHINLGYQDSLNNYADRNWHSELQPHINMGKIVNGVEKYAHFSSLTDLTPYIDNALQRTHGSVIQSRFMELLHKQIAGTIKTKESLYLRKYGIDPKKWAARMIESYKESGGFKTGLGGYMSKSWQWQDLEAANLFNDGVFRGIQNTLVYKGMSDSPFFADNILGLFFHTFTGWTYAATNRYLIPSLQHADGEMLVKMLWMMGAGALVSPFRRISRGEDAWPEDMTSLQIAYEAFTDSGVFSSIGNVANIANFMSDDKLLGNLKNDKFKNRAKTGIFGISDVVSSTATRISDVIGMANSGLDEKDMKTLAHMSVITGAMYGHYMSDKLIEGMNLPRNKRAAKLENS